MGKAHGVITEDSDILVYRLAPRASRNRGPPPSPSPAPPRPSVSSQCPFPVLYKMDELGCAQKYRMGPSVLGCGATGEVKNAFLERCAKLSGDDGPRLFVQMCVLAGCDYLESMKNIGLLSASKLI